MSDRRSPHLDDAARDVDLQLLERLAAIVDTLDPVPQHVRELGPALFGFRDLDAQLMEAIEVDSGLEPVRGTAPTSRMHFFEFGELSLDVELTCSDGFCDVVGVVADPGDQVETSVTLQTVTASFTTNLDEDGRFETRHVPVGRVRIILEREGRPRLVTPWFDAE